uniref:DDE Tnp4 domain-containing protein n=1 Tax=Anas zonorhyncha TaxID=75864 RepID=A0A8B9VVD5_9AVES
MRRYRLDKAAIAGLCRELGADLESLTGRSHALPVAVKVTSALTFLASGSFQTATRDSTGISQSAMSNCLAQFLEALQRRAARYIAFPAPGRAAPAAPGAGGGAGAFPGVLGLLGSMHVALRAPSENEVAFRNARNFHSMNMQVVCDAAGAITNVVAKFPGSCPNAAVLENSALARLLEGARPEGAWLPSSHARSCSRCRMRPAASSHSSSAAGSRARAVPSAYLVAMARRWRPGTSSAAQSCCRRCWSCCSPAGVTGVPSAGSAATRGAFTASSSSSSPPPPRLKMAWRKSEPVPSRYRR